MSNSSLVSYTRISPNKTLRSYRNASSTGKISKITIHHMAGCISVESCGSWFAQSSAQCSSNYGIDSTGKIALYVPENYRSWCSSNGDNDNIAVTIEVANSKSGNPWPVSDKALAACIDLCVDICQRNGIEQLVYTGTKSGNLTRHDMFSNKVCPGPYLGGKFPYIVEQVNKRLGKPLEITASSVKPTIQYGDTSAYVEKCQELLMKLGYSIGVTAPTGYFGKNTLAAVKLFQKANGLEDDGIVGSKTWAKLFSSSAVKYTEPKTETKTEPTSTTSSKSDEERIWDFLYGKLGNAYGAAGMMGNLNAESALRSTNLQNTYEKSLGMTDTQYTAAVDKGTYKNFVNDSAGYGLAQWTYWSRKQALLNYASAMGKSIGDLGMQLDFLWIELSGNYASLTKALKSATSVKTASDMVLTQFERPSNQSDSVKTTRAGYGQTYYDKYAKTSSSTKSETTDEKKYTASEIEAAWRNYFVSVANSYLGYKESDGSHKKIIDIYNAKTPLPAGYKMLYSDPWCATYVSAMAIKAGLADTIIPRECSCGRFITLCRNMGIWHENENYTPAIGDLVLYDWDDGSNYASTDNTNSADHIGIVQKVSGKTIYVIEGNYSDSVKVRQISVNGRYLRGYAIPKFGSLKTMPPEINTSISKTEETCMVEYKILRKGDSNSTVRSWQCLLNFWAERTGKNYSCGTADGKFGSKTETATKNFQKAYGLSQTGRVDKAEWEVMMS